MHASSSSAVPVLRIALKASVYRAALPAANRPVRAMTCLIETDGALAAGVMMQSYLPGGAKTGLLISLNSVFFSSL
jgi:hypothetical protein